MTEKLLHDGLIDREISDKYPYPSWFNENAHRKEVKYLNIIVTAFWVCFEKMQSVTANEILEKVNSQTAFKTEIVTKEEVKECLDLSHFYGMVSIKQIGDIISYDFRMSLPFEIRLMISNFNRERTKR